MKRAFAIILVMFTMLAIAYVASASGADDSATPPKFRARRGKLVSPWDRITDITPDQRDKIIEIHQHSLDEIRLAKEREESDIWNLLTEPQKDEYRLIKGKGRLEVSTRPAPHPASTQPASTQPATTQSTH